MWVPERLSMVFPFEGRTLTNCLLRPGVWQQVSELSVLTNASVVVRALGMGTVKPRVRTLEVVCQGRDQARVSHLFLGGRFPNAEAVTLEGFGGLDIEDLRAMTVPWRTLVLRRSVHEIADLTAVFRHHLLPGVESITIQFSRGCPRRGLGADPYLDLIQAVDALPPEHGLRFLRIEVLWDFAVSASMEMLKLFASTVRDRTVEIEQV